MCTITVAKEQAKNVVREYLYKDEKGCYVMNERNTCRLPNEYWHTMLCL